jgi:hypothetical protein
VTGLLIAQIVASGMLCGLIWFVQVVHYPLFGAVGDESFTRYAGRHRARTTVVVAPLMFLELGCALALLPFFGAATDPVLAYTGLALVALVWGVTFFVSVPLHMKLDQDFDTSAHRALVATNWIRTTLWSARLGVALAMLVGAN